MRTLSLLVTLCSLIACRSPQERSQTIIRIRATATLQERIQAYETQVYLLPDDKPVISEGPEAIQWPVKRTFLPESGNAGQSFRYVFTALDEAGAIVSRLDITTAVVPSATRYLYIVLSEECLASSCQDRGCPVNVKGDGLRTSPAQAELLESDCKDGVVVTPPIEQSDMTADNAGSDAPASENNTTPGTMTGTPQAGSSAADGGAPGTTTSDATTVPDSTEECSGNPCGEGDCILNNARAARYECRCNTGFEPNEAGTTCVPRNDCAKDNGGCEDSCTPTATGEAECTCSGANRWSKADRKQCAEVQQAIELSTSGGSLVRTRPQVAFDPAGNGVVVWTERSAETGDSLWTARFRADTQAWEPATRFARYTHSSDAADLQLALDANGSGVVIWTAMFNGKRQLFAKRYRDGAFAPDVMQLDPDSEGAVLTPSIALDAAGDGLAVWTDTLFPTSKLRGARFHASSDTFTELENVLESEERFVFGTSVAVSNVMSGLVAWTDMAVTTIPDAGAIPDITNPIARSSPIINNLERIRPFASGAARSTSPDVVLDANGNGVAVWVQASALDSTRYNVVTGDYTSGSWTVRPAPLSSRGSVYSMPRLAIGGDGTSFATWRESTASDPSSTEASSEPLQTYGALRTAAGFGDAHPLGMPSLPAGWNDIDTANWTPEMMVTLLDLLQPTWSAAVGPDSTGFIAGASFITGSAPVRRELWLQRVSADQEPAQLVLLSDGDELPSRPSPVKLSVNANGEGAVVWDRQVNGRYHVFVNRLD